MEAIIQNPEGYEYGLPPPMLPPVQREVPRRLWTQSYSCFVTREEVIHFLDTTNGNAEFVADVIPYLPSLEAPYQEDPEIQTPPEAWYRAQLAFRGLTPNGEMEAVQTLLRKAGHLGMTRELKKIRAEMVRTYVLENKRKAEKEWTQLGNSLNAKAEFWPRRLLVDTFFTSPLPTPMPTADSPDRRDLRDPAKDPLRIDIQDWSTFQAKFLKAIEGMPIHYEVFRMPYHRGGEHIVEVSKDTMTWDPSVKQETAGNAQAEVAKSEGATISSMGFRRALASPPGTRR
ncbi:hypothetical protein H2200_003031 [Cladophialophora chaetospira]|uniref:Uncharacterized protein n=1 Tax=Cladophialophora chaetospira TaxID=386627 RepID=A0AA38XGK4_9EURO|nr:hypothetical protein H2200_003031 [Cladophialophora chaetospira]